MKKFSILLFAIGILIFLNVFIQDFSLTFWRNVEFLIGVVILFSGIFPHKKWLLNVNINGKNIETEIGENYDEVFDEVNEVMEDDDVPEFAKTIAKKSISYATKRKKRNVKRIVRNFLFGISAGILLIFSSLGLFGLNFSFWEFLLVIISTFLVALGLSSLIPDRRKIK